jgi:hypothetical protein
MRITPIALVFTVGCGGLAFTAGEQAAFDGGSPELDGEMATIDGGSTEGDGEIDAWSDKESTDGGSGLDSEALDGGFVGDAADAACLRGQPWQCVEGDITSPIQLDQVCVALYAADGGPIYEVLASPTAAACACDNTCACVVATNPCGGNIFRSCEDVPDAGPVAFCTRHP